MIKYTRVVSVCKLKFCVFFVIFLFLFTGVSFDLPWG